MQRVSPLHVTAYAVCSPLGANRKSVVAALHDGRSGLGPCPFELPFRTVVGRVKFDLPLLPAELQSYSTRPARMAAHLVAQLEPALQRARERWAAHRIGVLLGTSTAGADATEAAYKSYVHTGQLPAEYDFRHQHAYGAVLRVVRELSGVSGPSWMISTTCTSSAKPLASAQRLIAAGVLDAAIVGGVDTLCALTLTGFHSLAALSDEPCRPFSSERKGINIGEGGAFLLVERQGDALALLEGVGESSDAYHISAPHPEGAGAEDAMRRALALAGCKPDEVDHVNAHGTATELNDAAESKAIARVFGTDLPVVSTKGYTGHALGGAGSTEAVFSIMAIEEGWVPACLNSEPRDPNIALNIPTVRTTGKFRRVLSNSFAFGGNNVSVLVRGV